MIKYDVCMTKMSHDNEETIYHSPGKFYITSPSLFKPYCEYDIRETLHFLDNNVKRDSVIQIDSLLANVHGETTIQTFLDNLSVLEKIK